jgi:alpha-tubulin suppressor-like RCC1 family protein
MVEGACSPTTDNNWVSVSAGSAHTVALKSDGTLWAWGYNGFGQLGDGSITPHLFPEQICMVEGACSSTTDNNWVSVSAGSAHTVALKSDGTLWAWGWNFYGQLGDGSTVEKHSPEQICMIEGACSPTTDNNWRSVSAGWYHTTALKSDGTLWAWGYNLDGELGDSTTTDQNSPEQIGTDTNWSSLSAGWYHTTALKSDGGFWAWGYNSLGQLGDGTTTDVHSPEWIAWLQAYYVKRVSSSSGYYGRIGDAYVAASDSDLLQIGALPFAESPNFDRSIAVELRGGFNSAFTTQTGYTVVTGTVTISKGTVTVDSVIIQ